MQILFSRNVRDLRREKGLTQQALGDALGERQQKISDWEIERVQPDLSALWRLADYFDVSVDYLIGRTDY